MEWQQLEYFYAVAQTQHFTRAAELLSVTQSALSRSISKLEEDLGVQLFERRGRGVILNRYGREFYAKTSRSWQQMAKAKQDIQTLLDPDRGTVALAFLKTLGAAYVPNLVGAFAALHPHVQFQLHQNATNIMLDQLAAGEIDYCLSTVTESRPQIEWQPLWTEHMYAYVPAGHPLEHSDGATLAQLADSRFIALKPGYGTRTIMDQLFKNADISPHILFEGEEVLTLIGFVRARLGVTLLPEVQGISLEGIVRLPIFDTGCSRTIGLAWNGSSYLSPVAHRFRQFLGEYGRPSTPLTLMEEEQG
ncbi:MAG: putative HTH-type transcriptional regulator yybE [Paenibacillus sp.]|jgi:DNA-binding transcriptional LysR family regulator|nr:putative HTH-type transcriptional regulator yybE [Paenibacillus sp.]